mgnify:CR=1 FL=1
MQCTIWIMAGVDVIAKASIKSTAVLAQENSLFESDPSKSPHFVLNIWVELMVDEKGMISDDDDDDDDDLIFPSLNFVHSTYVGFFSSFDATIHWQI